MRLQDIMSIPVATVEPSTTIGEARNLMKARRIRHLVVSQGRQLRGVVSALDLAKQPASTAIADVMSTGLATAGPRDTIREAANRLRGRSIGCLPVIDGGRVVGIVTTSDLLDLLGRGTQRPIEHSTPWTLAARGPRKRRPTADRQRLSYSR